MTFAAFRHHTSRDGFEVVCIDGRRFRGQTTGVAGDRPWALRYAIELDDAWRTRRAEVGGVVLEADGAGHWRVDGDPAPALDGCLDVDLEASAFTNAFPVARGATDAPAAWVRFDLGVERLEQTYRRSGERTYAYFCPDLGFGAELVFGADGIVVEYPGIASRVR
jgi:uncharacterized protein